MTDTSGQFGDIVPVLAPLMTALTGLADATETLAGSGMATASSQAMAELAHEVEIAGPGFDEPVHAAHANAGMLRFASTDALRQFARLFESQPVPVYAHLALARTGLESAAYAFWIAARGIGAVARVQRLQTIRLRNTMEMKRSPISEYKAQGAAVMAQIRGQCKERDWEAIANERQVKVGDEQLPTSGALIKSLISEGGGAPELQRLGATAWWFQSGTSHGVNFALIESIEAKEHLPSPLSPPVASIFTSSRSVALQGIILGLGYRSMIEEHRRLFGWSNESWDRAVQALIAEYQRVISSAS
jgi:hypothetical protein